MHGAERSNEPRVPPFLERHFAPIEAAVWARQLARELGLGLLGVAVVHALLVEPRGPVALAAAATFVVAGVTLRHTPSRLAALLALAGVAVSLPPSVSLMLDVPSKAVGFVILLDLVAAWLGGRALAAALAYRRFAPQDTAAGP